MLHTFFYTLITDYNKSGYHSHFSLKYMSDLQSQLETLRYEARQATERATFLEDELRQHSKLKKRMEDESRESNKLTCKCVYFFIDKVDWFNF